MNASCTNCYAQAAKFCLCQNTVAILCETCLRKHEVNLPYEIHESSPLAHYEVLQELGIEGFRARKMQISSGVGLVRKLEEEELRQYQQVKMDIEQTSALYLQWIDYLHSAFLQIIHTFHQEKLIPMTSAYPQLSPFTYFVFSLGEINVKGANLVESDPVRKLKAEVELLQQTLSRSGGATYDYQDYFIGAINKGLQASFPQYASPPLYNVPASSQQYVQIPPVSIPIQPSVQQPASIPIQPSVQRNPRYVLRPKTFDTYLPFSRGNMLGKWDTRSQDLSRVQLPRRVDITKFVVSVVLPSGDVCCVGGRHQSASMAIVIDADNGSIYELGEMKQGRANPGLVYVDRALYVFGGNYSAVYLNTAEKYSFDQGKWTSISTHMADTRNQFNPVCHQQIIYIAGGYHSQKVETFQILQETFHTVPISLPMAFGTIAFIHNNELLILQGTMLIRWQLDSESAQQQSLDLLIGESNTCPQVYGNRVFFNKEGDDDCEIYVLELGSMTILKIDGLMNSSDPRCRVS